MNDAIPASGSMRVATSRSSRRYSSPYRSVAFMRPPTGMMNDRCPGNVQQLPMVAQSSPVSGGPITRTWSALGVTTPPICRASVG